MKRNFAVLGGDQRQLRLAELLCRDGHHISLWGFDRSDLPQSSLEAAAGAECVILPLPVTKDGSTLYLPLGSGVLLLEDLWPLLEPGRQVVCGGMLSDAVRAGARKYRLRLEDYFSREEVQIANAVPTAEGAIAEAMARTRCTLHGCRCLVIGYGRIGKILAQRLQALGAAVTVSARRQSDLAWAEAFGCTPVQTGGLRGQLGGMQVVFNTVPALILDRESLEELPEDAVVIDLASEPGGVDLAAAEALGLQAVWARGLPGKVAPDTAAQVLRGAIYHILEERGDPI